MNFNRAHRADQSTDIKKIRERDKREAALAILNEKELSEIKLLECHLMPDSSCRRLSLSLSSGPSNFE